MPSSPCCRPSIFKSLAQSLIELPCQKPKTAAPGLVLYKSYKQIPTTTTKDWTYNRDALAAGARNTYFYDAIPHAFKVIEPRLALTSIPAKENDPRPSGNVERVSESHPLPNVITSCASPNSYQPSPMYGEDKGISESALSITLPEATLHQPSTGPAYKESGLPQGNAEDIITWTDDHIDATDYKNMPDYDPDQEESDYDSTPPPETDSTTPTTERPDEEVPQVERYTKLHKYGEVLTDEISGVY